MRQITLNIPDEKYDFFMELIFNLDFVHSSEFDIPEKHKKIVRDRIATSGNNPNLLLDWDKVKNDFNL